MFRNLITPRSRPLGALALAGLLGGLLVVPTIADAAPRTKMVSGSFSGTALSGPACNSPVGLCTHGTLTGGLKGTYDFAATAVSAPDSRGVVLVSGNSVIQTSTGALYTVDSAVLNATVNSDGEFAALDEISDGTGTFGSTSGYIQLTGTFSAGVQSGQYTAKLVRP